MALSMVDKRGFLTIPQDLGAFFADGTTVYVVREFTTSRWYITSEGSSGGERFCRTKVVNGGVFLPYDVIMFIVRKDLQKVSVTLRNDSGEERYYINPIFP